MRYPLPEKVKVIAKNSVEPIYAYEDGEQTNVQATDETTGLPMWQVQVSLMQAGESEDSGKLKFPADASEEFLTTEEIVGEKLRLENGSMKTYSFKTSDGNVLFGKTFFATAVTVPGLDY